jgi:hypothetical protein
MREGISITVLASERRRLQAIVADRNAAQGFFAKLTRRRLKHGVFHSVVDLQAAINRFIAEHNEVEAKPFVWRAEPEAIIASRNRGFQALEMARE